MKFRPLLLSLAIVCLLIPRYAGAVPLLEETGFISGLEGKTFSFVADQTPLAYEVTLTDFEFPGAFDSLGVAITTSTDMVATLFAPGVTTFNAVFGTTYFANVLGLADSSMGVGLFGLRVDNDTATAMTPVPSAMLMFGTGIVGLVGVRFRKKK